MGAHESFRVFRYKRIFAKLMPDLRRLELPILSDDERFRIMKETYNLLKQIGEYVIDDWRLSDSQQDELLEIVKELLRYVKRSPRFKEIWEYTLKHSHAA